jgi:HD-GYP domain-containing protein (c-di-GMP phosphodiesterase class II)
MLKAATHHAPEWTPDFQFRIAEVIAGLSAALDLAEGQPPGHAARTCLIGMRIADELKLEPAQRDELFYALLLKDLGGSTNAAKICYLFGTDDRRVKCDLKAVDWSRMSQTVQFLRRTVMPDGAPLQRVLHAAVFALEGSGGPKKISQMRCEAGADFARRLGFSRGTAEAIRNLDERWDGRGYPAGLKAEEIPLSSRIASLAQTIDAFLRIGGPVTAATIAQERRGSWFDPAVVDAFLSFSEEADFWQRVTGSNPWAEAARIEPDVQTFPADGAARDRIARIFAEVVDTKSPWTWRHSEGVAQIAVGIAKVLGLPEETLSRIHRAGLLHDLGKLGVSNLILDKPGNLTSEEYVELRRHPEFTHQILGSITAFHDIAEMAATHHERLDGRGYHRGIPAVDLPVESRLLVVADICEALSARRPYRDAMPHERVHEILSKDAGTAVCPECVEALKTYHDQNDIINRVNDQLNQVDQVLASVGHHS